MPPDSTTPPDRPPPDSASPDHRPADGRQTDGRQTDDRQAIWAGIVVALVGYASSVAVVIQGLGAVGATTAQIASALVALAFAKGLVAITLSLRWRMPVSVAWTTPGAALLVTTGAVAGGFAAAVGAFVTAAGLVVLAGLWRPLGRLVQAIPTPIASAMLAGVLLKFCVAPFAALADSPALAAPVFALWLLVGRFAKLYAVPAAVAAAIALIAWTTPVLPGGGAPWWPALEPVWPVFTWETTVSLALPLFLVTMASQNIPGLAVLAGFGYRPPAGTVLTVTGAASAAAALLGGLTVNLAAITAALCAGPDAGPRPERRYIAAVVAGVGYIAFAALAGLAATVVTASPPTLIQAVAGLALLGAFGNAALAAFRDEAERLPALVTFLTTASGIGYAGIGPAFWGLLLGVAVHLLHTGRPAPKALGAARP